MSRPTLKQINSAANVLFGVNISKPTRKRELIRKRQTAHYVAHKIFGYSLEKTGFIIGGKNHSTVLHSCRTIENEMPYFPQIKDDVRRLTNMCNQKDSEISPNSLIIGLLKSRTVDPNIKVELRLILKLMSDENS